MIIEYIIILKGIPKMNNEIPIKITVDLKISEKHIKNINEMLSEDIQEIYIINSNDWNKARIEEYNKNEQ